MDDVFDIQDDIAQSVVKALKVKLQSEKKEPLVRSSTENSQAYDYHLRGLISMGGNTETDFKRAIDYFEKALQEDMNYAQAHSGMAHSYI